MIRPARKKVTQIGGRKVTPPPAQPLIDKPPAQRPAYYAWVYTWLVPVARRHGYALGLHGSMQRDLDVVAIPWTDDACSAEDLIEAMATFVPGWHRSEPSERPHGRRAWQILLGAGNYVDVSVMPRRKGASCG